MKSLSIASRIDMTYLKMDVNISMIENVVSKVKKYNFRSLVIPPLYIDDIRSIDRKIRLTTVISFPLGKDTVDKKIKVSLDALNNGADEVDVVSNVSYILENRYDRYFSEVKEIVKSIKEYYPDKIVKLICEITLLSPRQLLKVLGIINQVKPDFFKTSTGFGYRGTSIGDVIFIRRYLEPEIGLKASGGIRSFIRAKMILDSGADIIGSSSGIKIIEEERKWYYQIKRGE